MDDRARPGTLSCPVSAMCVALLASLAGAIACSPVAADGSTRDGDPAVDQARIGAVGIVIDTSARRIARLVQALGSANNREAEAAADSLAAIGPAATAALIPVIQGNDRQARYLAVKAMADYGPRASAAVPALTVVVEQREYDDQTVDGAIRALGRIGPAAGAAAPVLARLLDEQIEFPRHEGVYEALSAMGPAAAAALPAVLRNLASRGAPMAAARIGGPEALTALERALLTPGWRGTNVGPADIAIAVAAMGDVGLQALERARVADAPSVRSAAIAGYRSSGTAGVSGLVAMLAEPRPCRSEAFSNEPIACAAEAARALAELGPPARAALPALERLLGESPDRRTQNAAREAIASLKKD